MIFQNKAFKLMFEKVLKTKTNHIKLRTDILHHIEAKLIKFHNPIIFIPFIKLNMN